MPKYVPTNQHRKAWVTRSCPKSLKRNVSQIQKKARVVSRDKSSGLIGTGNSLI